MKKILLLIMSLSLVVFSFAGCVGSESEEAVMPADLAAEIQVLEDHTAAFAAEKLDGEWADRYVAFMATVDPDVDSQELMSDPEYRALSDIAVEVLDEYDSWYAYIVAPDGETYDDEGRPHFFCMMDTYEPIYDTDPYMYDYGWEWQFQDAWENDAPSSAPSAWLEEGEALWSTFAPIHDSEGNLVALLGVDSPGTLFADYPEWNRDAQEWNGLLEGPVVIAE